MILTNFFVGLPAMLLCIGIQASISFWCVRYYVRQLRNGQDRKRFIAGVGPLLIAMVAMMASTFVQVGLWGMLFMWLGEFSELYEATYHSAVNFASLGYGDIVMSKAWKLLGPLEAINGVLMLGMSAAALMAILQHMIKTQMRLDPASNDAKN
jgi:hypothetical protein